MTEPEFISSVNRIIQKAVNKSRQNNADMDALSDPDYWPREIAKMNDPLARSYDAIAPFILLA